MDRDFVLRKLHSLSGVVPLGAFLILHLWTNAKALQGKQAFEDALAERVVPFGLLLELCLIVLPLLFHAGYGLKIALSSRPNVGSYSTAKNWGHLMQRVTGVVALVFIASHVWQFRAARFFGKLESTDFYGQLCAGLSSTQGGVPWMALGYLIGVAACVFHFTNGLHGFCFSFGLTASRRATRFSSLVFGVLGIVLFALGASIVIYFATGSRLLFAAEGAGLFATTVDCQSEPVDGPVMAGAEEDTEVGSASLSPKSESAQIPKPETTVPAEPGAEPTATAPGVQAP